MVKCELPPVGRGKHLSFIRHKLPHWEIENGAYFITICLHGAIPEKLGAWLHSMSETIRELKTEEIRSAKRRMFVYLEKHLHHGDGVRHLENPAISRLVVEAIRHREETEVWMPLEWCIMPNHLHLFVRMVHGTRPGELVKTMEEFKRWTGRRAIDELKGHERKFWHNDWFDHWSRSEKEDTRIGEYIRNNPVKAGLVADYRKWPWGSWSGGM